MKIPTKSTLLFATIAAGGGHVATARAMSEAIERYYPGQFEMRISDYMKDLGHNRFDQQHKDSWRFALRYPLLARLGQRLIDSLPQFTIKLQRLMLNNFASAAAKDLSNDPPLLVISNHGLITTGLALAKRRYGLTVPVLTFATEPNNVSAYWADPWAEHIITPAEKIKHELSSMGVPQNRLTVVGYPVRQAFLSAPSKEKARKQLGLKEEFTCLLSLGGEGIGGQPQELISTMLGLDIPLQIIVITGKNTLLKAKLEQLKPDSDRLRVMGFVNDMARYLAASDVVVGKAGPASVYETLAVGRPVLISSYAGLNEKAIVQFVEQRRIGHYVKTPSALRSTLRHYASNPKLLSEVSERCQQLNLDKQTEELAHYIVDYARKHQKESTQA